MTCKRYVCVCVCVCVCITRGRLVIIVGSKHSSDQSKSLCGLSASHIRDTEQTRQKWVWSTYSFQSRTAKHLVHRACTSCCNRRCYQQKQSQISVSMRPKMALLQPTVWRVDCESIVWDMAECLDEMCVLSKRVAEAWARHGP